MCWNNIIINFPQKIIIIINYFINKINQGLNVCVFVFVFHGKNRFIFAPKIFLNVYFPVFLWGMYNDIINLDPGREDFLDSWRQLLQRLAHIICILSLSTTSGCTACKLQIIQWGKNSVKKKKKKTNKIKLRWSRNRFHFRVFFNQTL